LKLIKCVFESHILTDKNKKNFNSKMLNFSCDFFNVYYLLILILKVNEFLKYYFFKSNLFINNDKYMRISFSEPLWKFKLTSTLIKIC
jgi:hypothetical protein